MDLLEFHTLNVRISESVCFVQLHRPDADNAINEVMIDEFRRVLSLCRESMNVVVIEGTPEVFTSGADLASVGASSAEEDEREGLRDARALYDLWLELATAPYISIAHVRGRVNAGGIGFIAASDIVLADESAQFSLSELLFGLFPACVLPFLIRRIGRQRAHYMTLMTQPVPVEQAHQWGLVDAYAERSGPLLGRHLRRLRCLTKTAVGRYKQYQAQLDESMVNARPVALAANRLVFSDPENVLVIRRYMERGLLPFQQ